MKSIIKTALLTFCLVFIAPVLAHAGPTCSTKSEDDFIAGAVKNNNAQVLKANEKALTTIITAINDARLKVGQTAFDVDTLMIGVFSYEGARYVGTVMFKNHCVVDGTVKVFKADEFMAFMNQMGLSADDFTVMRGA